MPRSTQSHFDPASKSGEDRQGRKSHQKTEYLTSKQAAELLQVPVSWIHQQRFYGRLPFPYARLGPRGHLRFRRRDIVEYLERQFERS